ncbi:amidohydrolase, partial [Acidobacteriota bacterium]
MDTLSFKTQTVLFLLITAMAVSFSACSWRNTSSSQSADLVLRNGKIVTMDERRPEAVMLAVRGDTIVAVGSEEDIRPFIGPSTKIIDLDGSLAIPGFIEGHGHFRNLGKSKLQLFLRETKSWDEVLALVKKAVAQAEPGEVIWGRGWHQDKWDRVPVPHLDGIPTHHTLSDIAPDNAVILKHASGHSVIANAMAMSLAGIAQDTPDPPGGTIVRDSKGNPTGLFRENAEDFFDDLDLWDEAVERKKIKLAAQECLAKGITSFQDAGSKYRTIDLFKKVAEAGQLRVRLWVMIYASDENFARDLSKYRMINAFDKHLTVRGIKTDIDGALGSHGAWLLEPYNDMPSSTGHNTTGV